MVAGAFFLIVVPACPLGSTVRISPSPGTLRITPLAKSVKLQSARWGWEPEALTGEIHLGRPPSIPSWYDALVSKAFQSGQRWPRLSKMSQSCMFALEKQV